VTECPRSASSSAALAPNTPAPTMRILLGFISSYRDALCLRWLGDFVSLFRLRRAVRNDPPADAPATDNAYRCLFSYLNENCHRAAQAVLLQHSPAKPWESESISPRFSNRAARGCVCIQVNDNHAARFNAADAVTESVVSAHASPKPSRGFSPSSRWRRRYVTRQH
jgi:hypothetical protein